MSWQIFKDNVLRVMSDTKNVNSTEQIANLLAVEYDAAVKRGHDTIHSISLKNGNVDILKQLFKVALDGGTSYTSEYDLVGELGKGVMAYWGGAIMNTIPIPLLPAPGSTSNISVVSNIVTNAGQWQSTNIVSPNLDINLIIGYFITTAQTHLLTVSGVITTTSVYPPAGQPAPGIIDWTGYTITAPIANIGIQSDDIPHTSADVESSAKIYKNNIENTTEVLQNDDIEKSEEELLIESANYQYKLLSDKSILLNTIAEFNDTSYTTSVKYISADVKRNLDKLEAALKRYGITNEYIITAVKAVSLKETRAMNTTEQLNYSNTSNDRIRSIFATKTKGLSDTQIDRIKQTPESMGNFMYSDVGGYKYRGRGMIQITGVANYTSYAKRGKLGTLQIISDPDILSRNIDISVDASAWYINRGLNMTDRNPTNQLDANLLITNMVAGRTLSRNTTSQFFSKIISIVDEWLMLCNKN
jgi:putative chitinase